VEGEDHVDGVGEQRGEVLLGHPVRVVSGSQQPHQVDHVHDPDLQAGEPLAEDLRGSDRVHRDDVAGAGEHDVGVARAIVVAGPVPHPRTVGAVLSCLFYRQPLQLRLLVDDDEVDQRS
jgi:hypothetical protein